jgi:hypothetical protein
MIGIQRDAQSQFQPAPTQLVRGPGSESGLVLWWVLWWDVPVPLWCWRRRSYRS